MLIVDDCSTDRSAEIIQTYVERDTRIRYLRTENPSGSPSLPRNIGLQQAQGEYIAFLDSDDAWFPNKLEEQVAFNVRTGEIKVQKFYALQDAGTPINPEIALCQMYGAAMKSIGHTLYEDMKLDENGKCINANLTDYGAPMIGEAPEDFKSVLIDVNDDFGPFGAKSISEIACNGAAPAIGIAIHDACGVWMRSWPMTPEKLLHELGRI